MWLLWVPVCWLVSIRFQVEIVRLNPAFLMVPLSVWFGHRYGWKGIVITLLGGLVLLLDFRGDMVSSTSRLDLYIIAFISSLIAVKHKEFPEILSPGKWGIALIVFLVIITPLSIRLNLGFDALQRFNYYGIAVLYYLLFLMGASNVKWKYISWPLLFISLVGLGSNLLDMAVGVKVALDLDVLRVHYGLNRPVYILLALAYFFAGRYYRQVFILTSEQMKGWSHPGIVLGVLVVMSLSTILYSHIPRDFPYYDFIIRFRFANSIYVFPLVALVSGLLFGKRGVIGITIIVIYQELVVEYIRQRYIMYNLDYVLLATGFGVLGYRLGSAELVDKVWRVFTDPDRAPGSWLNIKNKKIKIDTPEEWQRQHDEVSNTIRRVMLTLIGYSFFCLLTLAAPDASLIASSAEIKIPFAGTNVSYIAFLIIGPLVLIGLNIYLHIFVEQRIRLGKRDDTYPLPYIFNMQNRAANLVATSIIYLLSVLVLFVFAWKALPRGFEAFWLGLLASGIGVMMAWVMIRHRSVYNKSNRFLWLVMSALIIISVIQLSIGRSILARELDLYQANLAKQNLRNVDLAGTDLRLSNLSYTNMSGANLTHTRLEEANLNNANLANAKLRFARLTNANLSEAVFKNADFSGADMQGVDLKGADLYGANMTGVVMLKCNQLTSAKNWQNIQRPKRLACGAEIPESKSTDRTEKKRLDDYMFQK